MTDKKSKKADDGENKAAKKKRILKAKKPKTLKNHVAIILDRSGSMESIREPTIKAFNENVQSIRTASVGQDADVSLFTFSNSPDAPTFFAAPVDSFIELTRETYKPDGGTALFDTILLATDKLGALKDANNPETSFLVIIISDGQENASKAKPIDVQKRLQDLEATKRWTFTYVGCEVADLMKMRDLGISVGNSRGFTATAAGVASTSALQNTASTQYFACRASGQTSSANLYDQAESILGISGVVVDPAPAGIILPAGCNVTITSAGSLPPTTPPVSTTETDETNPPTTPTTTA